MICSQKLDGGIPVKYCTWKSINRLIFISTINLVIRCFDHLMLPRKKRYKKEANIVSSFEYCDYFFTDQLCWVAQKKMVTCHGLRSFLHDRFTSGLLPKRVESLRNLGNMGRPPLPNNAVPLT